MEQRRNNSFGIKKEYSIVPDESMGFGSNDHNFARGITPQFSEPNEFANGRYQKSHQQSGSTYFTRKNKDIKLHTSEVKPKIKQNDIKYGWKMNNPMAGKRNKGFDDYERSFGVWQQPQSSGNNSQFNERISQSIQIGRKPNDTDPPRFSIHGESSSTVVQGRSLFQKAQGLPAPKSLHLTGSVDHVVRWHKMTELKKRNDCFIVYEVSGVLEKMLTKGLEQLLFLRADSGHILQAIFYAIDRELPHFRSGAVITATGRMVGRNKLHIFDAEETTKDELKSLGKLWFFCQHRMET